MRWTPGVSCVEPYAGWFLVAGQLRPRGLAEAVYLCTISYISLILPCRCVHRTSAGVYHILPIVYRLPHPPSPVRGYKYNCQLSDGGRAVYWSYTCARVCERDVVRQATRDAEKRWEKGMVRTYGTCTALRRAATTTQRPLPHVTAHSSKREGTIGAAGYSAQVATMEYSCMVPIRGHTQYRLVTATQLLTHTRARMYVWPCRCRVDVGPSRSS